MNRRFGFLLLILAVWGCGQPQGPQALPPAVVTVAHPVEQLVPEYEYFTGRTEAVESVDIRARLTGYLEKVAFEPGKEVKKGDLLFQIDSRDAKADLDRGENEVVRLDAALKYAVSAADRARRLVGTAAMSRDEFEKIVGDRDKAAAALASAKSNVVGLRLKVEYATINSPIDGRVGRNLITVGNLVAADTTLLTTIVAVSPMHAYCNVDERTVLRLQELIREGKFASARTSKEVPVELGLANQEGFPEKGKIDFVDNRVDPNTGTIQVRSVYPNPEVKGTRILTPGLFARLRLPVGEPRKSLLISERAIGSDQGQKFVYLVNEKNEVVYRAVKLGSLHEGLRVIERGVTLDDRVIINGLQRVRPGASVDPKEAGK